MPWPKKMAIPLIAACAAGIILLHRSVAAEVADIAHTANLKLRRWEMRPPSAACLAKKYPVTVAGATLYLPAAPVITIRAGMNSHHFQFNDEVRAICKKSKTANGPIHAITINFDFGIPVRAPFCQATGSLWGQHLCAPGSGTADGASPAIANIYSPTEYEHVHLLDSLSYANFVEDRDKADAEKHPIESRQAGIFDRYANGYWVARNGSWKNDAGEPFTLKCHDVTPAVTVSCSTTYRLKSGPQVAYHFNAPADRVEAVAKKVDENIRSMVAEFLTP